MRDYLSFVIKRLRERLWIKPLIVCVLSIGAVFLTNLMDLTELGRFLPEISKESTETLLKIMASSMLMMATFAVASMVAVYASASRSATPIFIIRCDSQPWGYMENVISDWLTLSLVKAFCFLQFVITLFRNTNRLQ